MSKLVKRILCGLCVFALMLSMGVLQGFSALAAEASASEKARPEELKNANRDDLFVFTADKIGNDNAAGSVIEDSSSIHGAAESSL